MTGEGREAIAKVANESMSPGKPIHRARALEAPHRAQALLQMSMISLNSIVQVAGTAMLGIGDDDAEGRRIALGLVRRDPLWCHTRLVDRTLEERLRCLSVPSLRKVGVHDLSILVNRSVNVGPLPVKTAVCLVYSPFSTHWAAVSSRSFTE